MPRIEVTPAALRGAGARATAVGGELRGLAGHVGPALDSARIRRSLPSLDSIVQ